MSTGDDGIIFFPRVYFFTGGEATGLQFMFFSISIIIIISFATITFYYW